MTLGISVLTLASGRRLHLARLIEGLCRSTLTPDELIIVDMGGPLIKMPATSFPVRILPLKDRHLPLAQARNLAASAARHEFLICLDVDCIPMAGLLGAMQDILIKHNALVCAGIRYLKEEAIQGDWKEDVLLRNSSTHTARIFPATGVRVENNPGLFWSLAYGIRRDLFISLGGYNEQFTGYGGEDTDFGFRVNQAKVDLLFLGGPGAFHQYHEIFDPPLQHFKDIIQNAQIFYDIWNIWPMQDWLHAFEHSGFIYFNKNKIIILKIPHAFEIYAAKQHAKAYS